MRFLPAVILLGHDTFFQPSSDSQGSPSQVFLGSWNQQVVILCDAHNLSIWWTKWSFEGTQTIWCLLVSSAPESIYIRDNDLHQIIICISTSRKMWHRDVLVHHWDRVCRDVGDQDCIVCNLSKSTKCTKCIIEHKLQSLILIHPPSLLSSLRKPLWIWDKVLLGTWE